MYDGSNQRARALDVAARAYEEGVITWVDLDTRRAVLTPDWLMRRAAGSQRPSGTDFPLPPGCDLAVGDRVRIYYFIGQMGGIFGLDRNGQPVWYDRQARDRAWCADQEFWSQIHTRPGIAVE